MEIESLIENVLKLVNDENQIAKSIFNEHEVYRVIKDYPRYMVSSFGNVKNIKTGRILRPGPSTGGYLFVGLHVDGKKQISKKIHKLVSDAFLLNLQNKRCVDHIDHNRQNNRLSNLRLASHHENSCNKSKQLNNKTGYIGVSKEPDK